MDIPTYDECDDSNVIEDGVDDPSIAVPVEAADIDITTPVEPDDAVPVDLSEVREAIAGAADTENNGLTDTAELQRYTVSCCLLFDSFSKLLNQLSHKLMHDLQKAKESHYMCDVEITRLRRQIAELENPGKMKKMRNKASLLMRKIKNGGLSLLGKELKKPPLDTEKLELEDALRNKILARAAAFLDKNGIKDDEAENLRVESGEWRMRSAIMDNMNNKALSPDKFRDIFEKFMKSLEAISYKLERNLSNEFGGFRSQYGSSIKTIREKMEGRAPEPDENPSTSSGSEEGEHPEAEEVIESIEIIETIRVEENGNSEPIDVGEESVDEELEVEVSGDPGNSRIDDLFDDLGSKDNETPGIFDNPRTRKPVYPPMGTESAQIEKHEQNPDVSIAGTMNSPLCLEGEEEEKNRDVLRRDTERRNREEKCNELCLSLFKELSLQFGRRALALEDEVKKHNTRHRTLERDLEQLRKDIQELEEAISAGAPKRAWNKLGFSLGKILGAFGELFSEPKMNEKKLEKEGEKRTQMRAQDKLSEAITKKGKLATVLRGDQRSWSKIATKIHESLVPLDLLTPSWKMFGGAIANQDAFQEFREKSEWRDKISEARTLFEGKNIEPVEEAEAEAEVA